MTGSMHLLAVDRARVLIDAGLFHGRRDEAYRVNSAFAFLPLSLDACVISHAHIDHSGNFPGVVKRGFKAKAYITPTTRELLQHMLLDSAHADRDFLIDYVRQCGRQVEKVFIVHGEPEQSAELKKRIQGIGVKAVIPRMNEGAVLTSGERAR